ncbi:hypothetical protein JTE90_028246 [Oedothorax gibbosus]|uniref:Sushi domain-containing protein n=1 Tax=Oedothorax gibbosus TaxID=931172 RepID=A0AAV6UTP3_9ARAC|nr:hypothetical protein JTE90_028246 [Oedothorax gibbosus]
MKFGILFWFFILLDFSIATSWNNLNCPAPRAPDNGLSFIFRNGELVHFRCHPGYQMIGKSVAHCVNNKWTHPAPECIPIRKWPHPSNQVLAEGTANYHNRKWKSAEKQRQLFNWGDKDASGNVYGDGSKRLPLINGIWPPQDHADQVLALGPQSTPGPRALVKEEIDIAELRNKQLEELQKQRYHTDHAKGRRRQGRKKNKNKKNPVIDESIPRETILSLGTTEDGQALSIAHTKPLDEAIKPHHKHRHHHMGKRKKNKNIDQKKPNTYDPAGYFNNIVYSRNSRVDTGGIPQYSRPIPQSFSNNLAEFRRRPVEQIQPSELRSLSASRPVEPTNRVGNHTRLPVSNYDASCIDTMFRREVPKIAPQIQNGFVYRYETKKNKSYPFNAYMLVRYRCFSGFSFERSYEQTLHCKNGSWIGVMPKCVQ